MKEKHCKDCTYCKPEEKGMWWWKFKDYRYAECQHPKAHVEERNLITGEATRNDQMYCITMRGWSNLCGREGRLWKSRVNNEN